jgi:hypothetical protein
MASKSNGFLRRACKEDTTSTPPGFRGKLLAKKVSTTMAKRGAIQSVATDHTKEQQHNNSIIISSASIELDDQLLSAQKNKHYL